VWFCRVFGRYTGYRDRNYGWVTGNGVFGLMATREYSGPAIDGTVQHLSEAPHWQGDGETVAVVDDAETGEVTTEGVPELGAERPDVDGQSTWDDWEWSA